MDYLFICFVYCFIISPLLGYNFRPRQFHNKILRWSVKAVREITFLMYSIHLKWIRKIFSSESLDCRNLSIVLIISRYERVGTSYGYFVLLRDYQYTFFVVTKTIIAIFLFFFFFFPKDIRRVRKLVSTWRHSLKLRVQRRRTKCNTTFCTLIASILLKT